MPYRFEIERKSKLLAVRFDGDITVDELRRFYFFEVPKLLVRSDLRGSIVDFSNATMSGVSPQDIRELAAQPPADPDAKRLRVIVATTPHVFGLSRMFELHGEETRPHLHVVSSLSQAYALLGVTDPKFEPVEKNPAT